MDRYPARRVTIRVTEPGPKFVMQLDLTDEETLALLNLLVETIEADKFPLSPRVQILRAILAKLVQPLLATLGMTDADGNEQRIRVRFRPYDPDAEARRP